ncbi:hypothetical protein [Streptococcus mutans]|uniref:hypothetical protein n=1 Tax=Streptococcus mutans TaxID=1309 RepID=UPI001454E67A|nr:hypothetical protein [Streptococcus mutans]NLQ50477.1 hypothetical protein [Streptococcus mutans]
MAKVILLTSDYQRDYSGIFLNPYVYGGSVETFAIDKNNTVKFINVKFGNNYDIEYCVIEIKDGNYVYGSYHDLLPKIQSGELKIIFSDRPLGDDEEEFWNYEELPLTRIFNMRESWLENESLYRIVQIIQDIARIKIASQNELTDSEVLLIRDEAIKEFLDKKKAEEAKEEKISNKEKQKRWWEIWKF